MHNFLARLSCSLCTEILTLSISQKYLRATVHQFINAGAGFITLNMARTKKHKPGWKGRQIKKEMEERKEKQINEGIEAGKLSSKPTAEELYDCALELREMGEPEHALIYAQHLEKEVQNRPPPEVLPTLILLGEINVELGILDVARKYFHKAVQLDPQGQIPEECGGGAGKFLWLAQICENGGKQSVTWFERGVKALRAEIAATESGQIDGIDEESALLLRVEKKRKLANALCGIIEIYMTDLSWEDDAETRCESLITEALAAEDETSPEVFQTLASIRLSQDRLEDAQASLKRSIETWKDSEPDDTAIPDFANRISLSRLLMEAEMEDEAMNVVDRLIQEDDESVEAWYLGGWCQYLIAERNKIISNTDGNSARGFDDNGKLRTKDDSFVLAATAMRRSRRWLNTCLDLFQKQHYKDDRLFEHATELVNELNSMLGPEDDEDESDEELVGVDDEEDEDELMADV